MGQTIEERVHVIPFAPVFSGYMLFIKYQDNVTIHIRICPKLFCQHCPPLYEAQASLTVHTFDHAAPTGAGANKLHTH